MDQHSSIYCVAFIFSIGALLIELSPLRRISDAELSSHFGKRRFRHIGFRHGAEGLFMGALIALVVDIFLNKVETASGIESTINAMMLTFAVGILGIFLYAGFCLFMKKADLDHIEHRKKSPTVSNLEKLYTFSAYCISLIVWASGAMMLYYNTGVGK